MHVHFVHDIKTILSFIHVEDWLSHELVKGQDIVLSLEVVTQRVNEECLKKGTLGDERVDLLLFNLPANSVDKQSNFDRVVLIDHGVRLGILNIENLLVDIDNMV